MSAQEYYDQGRNDAHGQPQYPLQTLGAASGYRQEAPVWVHIFLYLVLRWHRT